MIDAPFTILGAERRSRFVIACDHASNRVPVEISGGSLGLPEAEMNRHIAYDIGAAGVTRALADSLGAPAILSNFSRLVIDPNRGEDDPTLIMQLYDGTIVPGNRAITEAERTVRLDRYYRPYDRAYAELVASRTDPVVIAVHSFTPQLKGRPPRPWDVGILSAADRRFAAPLIDRLMGQQDLCIGDNEPYAGHLPGDAIDRRALQLGHLNALIELRHDLIDRPDTQQAWGARLAGLLTEALADCNG